MGDGRRIGAVFSSEHLLSVYNVYSQGLTSVWFYQHSSWIREQVIMFLSSYIDLYSLSKVMDSVLALILG